MESFEKIIQWLNEEGYACPSLPSAMDPWTREMTFPPLDIYTEWVEVLNVRMIVPPESLEEEAERSLPGLNGMLQITCAFRSKVTEKALWEMLRALNIYNGNLDHPGFVLQELDQRVYYRILWPLQGEALDRSSFFTLLGVVLMVAKSTGPDIERIAQGEPLVTEMAAAVNNAQQNSP